MFWRTLACGVAVIIAVASPRAQAQEQHFHVSAGYAHMSLGGDEFAEDFDGWGLAARLRARPFDELENLMLGASFQLTFYDGEGSPAGARLVGGQVVPVNESISDVDVFSPTFDLAWRQPLGPGFFVEPGIGVGWAWGSFTSPVRFSRQRTEDGLVVRPGVIVGYGDEHWTAGVDFQYSLYWIDFSGIVGDLDDRHDEMYVGVFLRYSF